MGNESIPVLLAKRAYVKGNIDLQTLERALDDRLVGNRHQHDDRIDGYIPNSGGDDGPKHPY